MSEEQIDFLAIGDTVVDAFIKLQEAHLDEHQYLDRTEQELCMPFATKIPYESVTVVPAVGNSANATVAASRLGLKTSIVTFLGNDINGRECKFTLENEKIDTKYVIMEQDKITNYHYVLWFGDERTILIKHENFRTYLPDISKPKWIYLSSLATNTEELHFEILKYLQENPDVKLAFQPGTFQIKMGAETLKDMYKRTEFFCCNVEEAQIILNNNTRDVKTLLQEMQNLGPKIVCITDGKKGSFVKYDEDVWYMPIYPDQKPPLERTGAGDAFTSTFVSCLIMGMKPEEAIVYAPINSMNVVQFVGAQKGLLKLEDIQNYIKKAPESYIPIKL